MDYITLIGSLIFVVYLMLLRFRPRGIWLSKKKIADNPQIHQRMNKAQSVELEAISAVSARGGAEDNAKEFSSKLARAIEYTIKRHDWYEDQRSRILQIVITVCGIMLTVIGFTIKADSSPVWAYIPSLVNAIAALSIAIIYYNSELDQDRPYRLVSDIRFWFYRYNLPYSSNFVSGAGEEVVRADRVIEERGNYFRRLTENFSVANSIREDVEQLFILHVLVRSKSESLTKLRWLMSYSLVFLTIQLFIYLVWR